MESQSVRKIGHYYSTRARCNRVPRESQGSVETRQRSWQDLTVSHDMITRICYLSRCSARHLPKPVYQAAKLKRTMLDAQRVKEERRRKHTRAGQSKPNAERKKVVLAEHT